MGRGPTIEVKSHRGAPATVLEKVKLSASLPQLAGGTITRPR
jgi:hypothetical protein